MGDGFHFGARCALGGSFLPPIIKLSTTLGAFGALCLTIAPLAAQEVVAPPPQLDGVSPEAAPAPQEAAPAQNPSSELPSNPVSPQPEAARPVNNARDLPTPAAAPSRLFAAEITSSGGIITATGTPQEPVRFETSAGRLTAERIQIDTTTQVVEAQGKVYFERQKLVTRPSMRPRGTGKRVETSLETDTVSGQNLRYDFKNQAGKIDDANLQLAALTISASSLFINGTRYTAKNVILRPGGMSEADSKIYGIPPFNIRAKSLTATAPIKKSGQDATAATQDRVEVKGGGLYFKNTRIIPLPAYVFAAGLRNGDNEEKSYQLTPGISFNSADRVLVTTRLAYPLAKNPARLTAIADIGLSERVGARGGIGLDSQTSLGHFALRARRNDIVETQLTNRIELNREPEISYGSPAFLTFPLPGGRRAGFTLGGSYGRYDERTIGEDENSVTSSRAYGRLLFTTHLKAVDGPFLRLFATTAHYNVSHQDYNSRGYEIGYDGRLLPQVRGRVSFRSTSIRGDTPFRFDEIEIRRELRSTFDVQLTPRYLLPVDLRYDLSQQDFRDATFGLLRSYKNFAYGLVYQTARRDLHLEVRQGF